MNKQITRNNYEVYFLDYIEGNLDGALQFQFQQFLKKNPDLKFELDEMMEDDFILPVDNIEFKHKGNLKKPVEVFGNLSFEEIAIARLEGDLSSTQSKNFDNYIESHKNEKKEYLLFLKTKLIPDLSVRFKDKISLKRFTLLGLTYRNFSVISAAASIILIFSVYMFASKYFIDDTRYYSARILETTHATDDNSFTVKNARPIKTLITSRVSDSYQEKSVIPIVTNNKAIQDNREAKRIIHFASLPKMDIKNVVFPSSKITNERIDFRTKKYEAPQIASLASDDKNEYLSPKQFLRFMFKQKVLHQNAKEINNNKIDLWEIADAGIDGLNKFTGSKMDIKTEYDKSGDLVAYGFSSSLVSFEKTKSRRN